MSKISIIGSGVVGETIGRGFSELGNDVIFYDIDGKKIENLRKEGLDATTDLEYTIQNSEVSFVCVPTPTINDEIDLTYIKTAITNISQIIKNKASFHTIVIKSTIVPTTCENVILPLIEQISGKKSGKDFGLCSNPEFLTEINKSWTNDTNFSRNFFSEDRIVIGENDKRSGDVLESLYAPLKKPIFRTNLTTAELIKYANNNALASRISYWNEIYFIAQRLGVDSNFVAKVVGMDPRIGIYGTVHGKAFGGKCLPKDLKAFIKFARSIGEEPIISESVHKINEKIKEKEGVRE